VTFSPGHYGVTELLGYDSQPVGECVKASLREILAHSRISAVAIALLLLWSLNSGNQALWKPLPGAMFYLATSAAIRGIPHISFIDRVTWTLTLSELLNALICFGAAWLLSRWVYGVGPFRSLSKYRTTLAWRPHV